MVLIIKLVLLFICIGVESILPLSIKHFENYKNLFNELIGDLGISLISEINFLELAKDAFRILDEFLSLDVDY